MLLLATRYLTCLRQRYRLPLQFHKKFLKYR